MQKLFWALVAVDAGLFLDYAVRQDSLRRSASSERKP